MVKKTLLSLAVATALTSMVGCNVSSTDKYDNKITTDTPATQEMPKANALHPIFAPENSAVPVATDFVFSKASETDGTADTKVTEATFPVTTALNRLAGFSTTAPIYINMSEEPVAGSVIAGKTVILIKLNNAEVNPAIDALDIKSIVANSAQGNPIDVAATMALNDAANSMANPDYEASVVNLGPTALDKTKDQYAIRILPKKPLDSKTKYIVVLTDDIANASGPASGSSTYQLVAGNKILPSAALNPVRDAIHAYENIAGGFLATAQGLDASNPEIVAAVKSKIVLSYAFTTDASLDDLKQYAAPGLFVKNNVPLAFAESQLPAGASDQIAGLILQSQGVASPTAEQLSAAKKSDAYATQVFKAIASEAGLNLTAAAVAPAPRDVALVRPAAVDAALDNLSSGLSALGASPYVLLTLAAGGTPNAPGAGDDISTRYIQGSIQLPDFLGKAEKTDLALAQQNGPAAVAAAMRSDNTWAANEQVGAILSAALNKPGAFPPKDVNGSTNVTYRYPFPAQVGTNSAPFLLTLPDNTAGTCQNQAPFKTVIFVHGITSNRAGSAVYASQLAKACIATVAIDLPVHGVAPADGALTMLSMDTAHAADTKSPWAAVAAGAMAEAAGVAPIGAVNERHNNVYQVAADDKSTPMFRMDMNYGENAVGDSGSTFINLQNFTRTKDNLRQAVTDLLNLNASLVNINKALTADAVLGGAEGSANRGTLDLNNVFVAGHSLGGIVASAFVAANNDRDVQAFNGAVLNPADGSVVMPGQLPEIKGLIIANSGGHLTKLLENSPAFAPTIVKGLAANGTMQGTENYEKFLTVFQATVDGVDPANTAQLFGSTPVQMFTVDGGLSAGDITSSPDNTVPVFDYFADETTNPFAAAVVPDCFTGVQSGTACEGKIALPNAGVLTAESHLAGTQAIVTATSMNEASVFGNETYETGTHSSFAKPDTDPTTFGSMAAKSIGFITSKTPSTNAN